MLFSSIQCVYFSQTNKNSTRLQENLMFYVIIYYWCSMYYGIRTSTYLYLGGHGFSILLYELSLRVGSLQTACFYGRDQSYCY